MRADFHPAPRDDIVLAPMGRTVGEADPLGGGRGGESGPALKSIILWKTPYVIEAPVALGSGTPPLRHLSEAPCTHGALSAGTGPQAPGPEFPLPQARHGLAPAPVSQDVQV